MKSSFNCRKTTCNKLVKQWFFKGLGSWFTLQSHSSLGFYFLQVLWSLVLSFESYVWHGSWILSLDSHKRSRVLGLTFQICCHSNVVQSPNKIYHYDVHDRTFPANICLGEHVVQHCLSRRLQDIFKTFSRHNCKTSSSKKTSCKHIFKTSWRRPGEQGMFAG